MDFWASWCKSCLAMDKTTFKDENVAARLEPYIKLKYAAENPRDPATKEVMDYFDVLGLPTYLILEPQARTVLGVPEGSAKVVEVIE